MGNFRPLLIYSTLASAPPTLLWLLVAAVQWRRRRRATAWAAPLLAVRPNDDGEAASVPPPAPPHLAQGAPQATPTQDESQTAPGPERPRLYPEVVVLRPTGCGENRPAWRASGTAFGAAPRAISSPLVWA